MNTGSIERDCRRCERGVLEHYFVLHPAEPSVGYMQGYAEYDYTTACNECGRGVLLTREDVEELEEDAFEELLQW